VLVAPGRPVLGYMTSLSHGSTIDNSCWRVVDSCLDLVPFPSSATLGEGAAGVRYVDAARSYGLAEEFLAGWLAERGHADVVVGSKWGYRYTGGWRLDAPVQEVKEHSLAMFTTQLAQSRALRGPAHRFRHPHELPSHPGPKSGSSNPPDDRRGHPSALVSVKARKERYAARRELEWIFLHTGEGAEISTPSFRTTVQTSP
jgi:hypothetical protein